MITSSDRSFTFQWEKIPVIRLWSGYKLGKDYDFEAAQKAAEKMTSERIDFGAVVTDDGFIYFGCSTIATTSSAIIEALPYMMQLVLICEKEFGEEYDNLCANKK